MILTPLVLGKTVLRTTKDIIQVPHVIKAGTLVLAGDTAGNICLVELKPGVFLRVGCSNSVVVA